MNMKKLKSKLCCLIERIKLSESDYRAMKDKSQRHEDMMSNVRYTINTNFKDVTDNFGNIIKTVYMGTTATIDVDIVKMLAAGGITLDKGDILNVKRL